mgnify:CR=1 FL=1
MTYNSIYGNTFKLPNPNNLINVPDFFFKLLLKIKNNKDIKGNNILNQSHNKIHNHNLQSDENLINNALIQKYDLMLNKNNDLLHKRKNSAFNILKLRKRKKIEEEDNDALNSGRNDVLNLAKDTFNETEITEKSKIHSIKTFSLKNIKNRSFYNNNSNKNNNYEYAQLHKKIRSNLPNVSKQTKISNNSQKGHEKNFKENYVNLRNFIGHLYYMKKKYKTDKTISKNSKNLILSNSRNTSIKYNSDSFKEQVNNLINKLKKKNKEINNRKTLNLCIVNVGSPYNIQNDVLSLTKSLFQKKNSIQTYKNYNFLAQSKSPKNIMKPVEISGNKIDIHPKNIKNNSAKKINEKIKINNNITKIVKKYKTSTDINNNNYINSNRNNRNFNKKSNSTKMEYQNIPRNKFLIYYKKCNMDKKESKLNQLNNNKHHLNEKEIEQLFVKNYITNNFDRRFSSYDVYYFKLNKMYNEQISEYMSHRINWEWIENGDFDDSFEEQKQQINFEWKYYPNKLYYKKYKYNSSTPVKKLCAINLFEKNYEIGNKKKMFIHLINYCDNININAFNYVPFTIIINNTRFIDEQLEALKEIMNALNMNKYTNISERKNLNFLFNKKYHELFWFDSKLDTLKNQNIFINKNFLSHKNYWILKPTDLYQGKCIEISSSFSEISKKCKKIFTGVDKRVKPELMDDEKKDNNDYMYNNNISDINYEPLEYNFIQKRKKKISNINISNELIIQKYLDNPLLYRKRKFDIRCFVLVDWNLNVFFCREGHLKASSFMYDVNNINKFIHITNHSFQKKSNKFEQFETGNEISYSEFKKYLQEEKIPLSNFDKIIKKMKFIVKLSFQAVGSNLMRTPDVLSFELFGYDFIVDNEYNPWLLEINNNPGLSISSPVIAKIIPRMMDDAFRLTIDKIFNTRYASNCFDKNKNYKSKFKLDGYNDNENIFEFLCNVKDNKDYSKLSDEI